MDNQRFDGVATKPHKIVAIEFKAHSRDLNHSDIDLIGVRDRMIYGDECGYF